jgi:hypothetical protein
MERRLISVVTTDIDAKVEEGYNEWYEQHIRDVMDVPGWIRARRYRCLDGEPRYMSVYDISSSEYAAIGSMSNWTTEMQQMQERGYEQFWPHIESYRARTYELISELTAESLRHP